MSEVKPVRLARRTIYENPWVSLYVDRVRFPGGRVIEAHHVLHFDKEAVATIVENARGDVLLVEAYRYVVDAIQWEIPAGGIDPGESILDAAAREAREESGCETVDHRLVSSFEPINGIGDKVHHLVHCRAAGEPGGFD
ncbi:MAG: NUDIX hydrolase, partial [Caldilinea sp.]